MQEAFDDGAPADSSAGELSAREKSAVLHRIRMLMEYWSITPDELEGDAPAVPAPPVAAAAPLPIKYRHPVSGETWDGNGPHPQWLRDALLKEGFTVDQLRAAVALN